MVKKSANGDKAERVVSKSFLDAWMPSRSNRVNAATETEVHE
jgi:hypothetical protein